MLGVGGNRVGLVRHPAPPPAYPPGDAAFFPAPPSGQPCGTSTVSGPPRRGGVPMAKHQADARADRFSPPPPPLAHHLLARRRDASSSVARRRRALFVVARWIFSMDATSACIAA